MNWITVGTVLIGAGCLYFGIFLGIAYKTWVDRQAKTRAALAAETLRLRATLHIVRKGWGFDAPHEDRAKGLIYYQVLGKYMNLKVTP